MNYLHIELTCIEIFFTVPYEIYNWSRYVNALFEPIARSITFAPKPSTPVTGSQQQSSDSTEKTAAK